MVASHIPMEVVHDMFSTLSCLAFYHKWLLTWFVIDLEIVLTK